MSTSARPFSAFKKMDWLGASSREIDESKSKYPRPGGKGRGSKAAPHPQAAASSAVPPPPQLPAMYMQPQQVAQRQGAPGAQEEDFRLSRRDMKAVSQLALEGATRSRQLAATVWWTLMIPLTLEGMAVTAGAVKAAGEQYAAKTRGQRNHGQGAPMYWLWGAFVKSTLEMVSEMVEEKEEGQEARQVRKVHTRFGAAEESASLLPYVTALSNHVAAIKSPLDLSHHVLHCQIRTSYDQSSLIVTFATSESLANIRLALFALFKALGVEPTPGTAPPSASERRVRRLLRGGKEAESFGVEE